MNYSSVKTKLPTQIIDIHPSTSLKDSRINLCHKVTVNTVGKTLVTAVYSLTDKEILDNRIRNEDDIRPYIAKILSKDDCRESFLDTKGGGDRRFQFKVANNIPTGETLEEYIELNVSGEYARSRVCVVIYRFKDGVARDERSPYQVFRDIDDNIVFDYKVVYDPTLKIRLEYPKTPASDTPVLSTVRVITDFKFADDGILMIKTRNSPADPWAYSLLRCSDKNYKEDVGMKAAVKGLINRMRGKESKTVEFVYEWKIPNALDTFTPPPKLSAFGISQYKYASLTE